MKEKKIEQMLTALYSCEDSIKHDTEDWMTLKYGGFSKQEAAIADDVTKLEVRDHSW